MFGVAFFAVVASTTAFVRLNYPPDAWPKAIAIVTIAFGIGQTLGPIAVGAITDATGSLTSALVASAATLAIGAIGSWQGTPLRDFLKLVGADTTAKYVWFRCAEDYTSPIDMPTALHAQTQMTFKFDNQILPRAYGFPMKIRVPTKLGFKNPKYVVSMEVTNDYKGGYWEDQGYNDFSGS